MSLHILDTDMLTLFQEGHPAVCQHVQAHPPNELAITVLSVEEQLSGWYTELRRAKRMDRLALVYRRLAETVTFLAQLHIRTFPVSSITIGSLFRHLSIHDGVDDGMRQPVGVGALVLRDRPCRKRRLADARARRTRENVSEVG